MAVALSAVMTPLCLNSDIAIALLGLPEETAAKTSAYVVVWASASLPRHLYGAALSHSGFGHHCAFAFASVVGFIANVPLNYMLIFGAWGAPELGAEAVVSPPRRPCGSARSSFCCMC